MTTSTRRACAGMFDGASELYAGLNKGFVPGAGLFIPSVEFGWNCFPAGDLYLGGNLRLGIQLPTSVPEIWAGGRIGYPFDPQCDGYLTGELGNIGGTTVNGLGAGLNYQIAPDTPWGFNASFGLRGPLGSFSEGIFKAGAFYKFDLGDNE